MNHATGQVQNPAGRPGHFDDGKDALAQAEDSNEVFS